MPKLIDENNHNYQDISIAQGVIEKKINALTSLQAIIDKDFIAVVDTLCQVKGRIIVTGMGKSGHIARKVSATFASTGSPSLFIHPSEAGHGDLGMISIHDVVIMFSNSGQTVELNSIISYCQRFSIKMIAITSNHNSVLAQASNFTLLLPRAEEACDTIPAPTTSTTMMLAIGDALAVCLYKRRDFSVLDFSIFHPGGNLGSRLMPLSELMLRNEDVPLVDKHTQSVVAIDEITKKRLGCVGVVDENNLLIGIVTDGDLRRNLHKASTGCNVTEIMTKNPLTLMPNNFAQEAMALMSSNKITNLFITDHGRPVGIIHMHHLLRIGVL